MSIEDFISRYVPQPTSIIQSSGIQSPNEDKSTLPAESSQQDAIRDTHLDVYSAATISDADLEACLDLVELTSGEAYAASGIGWSRPKKFKEMKLPDMKYLVVRGAGRTSNEPPRAEEADKPDASRGSNNSNDANTNANGVESPGVFGFLSFMVTYEDGKEIIYCYEIHLAPAARGRGLGIMLMNRMEEIGRLVGLEKAMLTVFKSNAIARRFYERGGYEVDEYSPQPRKLRNGTIKEFDYLILSKPLRR